MAPPQRPGISLPALRPFEERALRADGDYDGLAFTDLDLGGAEGAGATFLECGVYRCALGEAVLRKVRLIDSVFEGVTGVGTNLASAEFRDVELTDARLGGVQLHGSRLMRTVVRGGKIDFLNLRQSVLTDVVFEDCVLIEPDFADARLERVSFAGCVLRQADFHGATMKDVDLRDAAELGIAAGLDRLAGAVISSAQLLDLAPALALQLGIRVEDGHEGGA
nr:pentapeptide repeat-containing protein [Streptomyces gossypii]